MAARLHELIKQPDNLTNNNLPDWLVNFIEVYQKLNVNNLALLSDIYHQEIVFCDPLHNVEGIPLLTDYFQGMYLNLSSCHFVIDEAIVQQDGAALYWTMHYVHPKLNRGKVITVQGHSLLKMADNKVIFHRDYLDVGEMIYEQLPLIGRMIKAIKKRVSQ